MKLRWLLLAFAGALASGGLLLAYESTRPIVKDGGPLVMESRHDVTAEMRKDSAARELTPAPKFSRTDHRGRPVTIGDPQAARPQLVLFIKFGCPCSIDVEPIYHKLYDRYGDKVDFVGVIDKPVESARQWQDDLLTPFSIVPDPEKKIARAFRVGRSAYAALIREDGRIVRLWPGYSRGILAEVNELIASEIGLDAKPFDVAYAPEAETAGCDFFPGQRL
ncbi:MAG: redoxin domain-containing protein [Fimbriimonadaceae bacterium]|nr:redoxin domain-containing protein [Fimbriimonadaceae bacterium]